MTTATTQPPAALDALLLPRPHETVEQYAHRLRALHAQLTALLEAIERGRARGHVRGNAPLPPAGPRAAPFAGGPGGTPAVSGGAPSGPLPPALAARVVVPLTTGSAAAAAAGVPRPHAPARPGPTLVPVAPIRQEARTARPQAPPQPDAAGLDRRDDARRARTADRRTGLPDRRRGLPDPRDEPTERRWGVADRRARPTRRLGHDRRRGARSGSSGRTRPSTEPRPRRDITTAFWALQVVAWIALVAIAVLLVN